MLMGGSEGSLVDNPVSSRAPVRDPEATWRRFDALMSGHGQDASAPAAEAPAHASAAVDVDAVWRRFEALLAMRSGDHGDAGVIGADDADVFSFKDPDIAASPSRLFDLRPALRKASAA